MGYSDLQAKKFFLCSFPILAFRVFATLPLVGDEARYHDF